MAKYDDAAWHYNGDFPKDLPKENGATHIGMLLTWCIEMELVAEEQVEDNFTQITQVKNRTQTGVDFLFNCCDGKFTTADLNEVGNGFIQDYYDDETPFAQAYSDYLSDYAEVLNIKVIDHYLDHDSLYRLENSWANYDLLVPILNQRFRAWQNLKSQQDY